MTKITMESIRARCIEDGDCLIWKGKVSQSGQPIMWSMTGRRKVWSLVCGPVPDGKLIGVSCGCKLCLNPGHLALLSRADVTRVSHGRPDVKALRATANARTARAKFAKINMDIARKIRASTKSGPELSTEFGCSASLVSLVRLNKAWVETASPWAGLGARSST